MYTGDAANQTLIHSLIRFKVRGVGASSSTPPTSGVAVHTHLLLKTRRPRAVDENPCANYEH
eukprot:359194-Chlamydomonas_euryale.AAC.16